MNAIAMINFASSHRSFGVYSSNVLFKL